MADFTAVLATQEQGTFAASVQRLAREALPPGDVLLRVAYSSLNYKDGLAVTGKPGVIRTFPMVPGIDIVGVVEESSTPEFEKGDSVVVTGCGTSETMWGGYAQFARLNAEYIVPLPRTMTPVQAMGVGTAGFTSMQSVMALERHGMKPGGREIVVTGAAGGVGSVAVAILAKLGYTVVATTGRAQQADYLRGLGAATVIDRAELTAPSKRPLEAERWGGAIDSVGGDTLASVIRAMEVGGSIAGCGLAGGAPLNTTVYPFILRGVNLLGIDSLRVPKAERLEIWARLEQDLPLQHLDAMVRIEPMTRIFELGKQVLAGQVRGRTVIDVNA